MSRNANIEDVAQDDPINEFSQWLNTQLEELEPLPTPSEAGLGELCRTPSEQFKGCTLVDDQTPTLLGVIEGSEPKGSTDEEVSEAIPKVEDLEGGW